ncbi:MAG: hypothetical protein ING69_04560 [Rhodocyclaceae bacterium]|nr:hypothetical protein [Rhodocyclaceae bacterium]
MPASGAAAPATAPVLAGSACTCAGGGGFAGCAGCTTAAAHAFNSRDTDPRENEASGSRFGDRANILPSIPI